MFLCVESGLLTERTALLFRMNTDYPRGKQLAGVFCSVKEDLLLFLSTIGKQPAGMQRGMANRIRVGFHVVFASHE